MNSFDVLKNLQFFKGGQVPKMTDMDQLLSDLELGEMFYIMIPGPGYEEGFDYALHRNKLPPGVDVTDGAYWSFPATGHEASREELVSALVKIVLTVLNLAIAHNCGKVLTFHQAVGQNAETLWELTSAIHGMIAYNEAEQPSRWSSVLNAHRSAKPMTPESRRRALQQLEGLLRLDFSMELFAND